MLTRDDDVQFWQLWKPFVGIHRWFYMRGCPPTIRRLRGWTRIVHASVLTGVLGLFTGLFGVLAASLLENFGPGDISYAIVVLTGGIEGALLLVPLGLWTGRSHPVAAFGIAWMAGLFSIFEPVMTLLNWLNNKSLWSRVPVARWSVALLIWREAATWGCQSAYLAGGSLLWLLNPRRPRTWWRLLTLFPIGFATAVVYFVVQMFSPWHFLNTTTWVDLTLVEFLLDGFHAYHPLIVSFTLTAVVSGSLLWFPVDSVPVLTEIPTDRAFLPDSVP